MPGIPFTEAEVAVLHAALKAGMKVDDIALNPEYLPTRTHDSIRQYMRRHKLANQKRSAGIKKFQKFTPEARAAFEAFLKEEGGNHTLKYLRNKWNRNAAKLGYPKVAEGRVHSYLSKLELKLPQTEVRRLPEVKAKIAKSFREKNIRLKKKTDDALAAYRIQLQQKKTALLRLKPEHPQLKCSDCPDIWPLTAPFFLQKRRPDNTTYLATVRCSACENSRRIEHGRRKSQPAGEVSAEATLEKRIAAMQRRSSRLFRLGIQTAKEKKRAVLAANPETLMQGCCICPNIWPATREFFHENPRRQDGSRSLRPDCIWCQLSYMRQLEIARVQGLETKSISTDYGAALRKAYRLRLKNDAESRSLKLWHKEIACCQETAAAVFAVQPDAPSKRCLRCGNNWPIVDYSFFPQARIEGKAIDAHRRICGPCTRRHKRTLSRYKVLKKSTMPLKTEIHKLIRVAQREEGNRKPKRKHVS